MGLADRMDIPKRHADEAKWSFKRLFPAIAGVGKLVKTFTNPLEILLAVNLAFVGIIEVLGRHPSIGYVVLIGMLLTSCTLERRARILLNEEDKTKTHGK